MKRVLEFLKSHKYFVGLFVFIGFNIIFSTSYSNYFVESNNHKAAEMYIGELKYSIEIDNENTNTLTVPTGETIIDVKVNNLNPVDTYYKLLYLKNTNITVKYYESTKDTDEVVTTYNKPNDSITSSNSNTIKLLITNNSESSQNVALIMKGGYITNTIQDITTPSTYSEITTVETPSSNTYFCKTDDTLTQGLEYVNGGYTYGYKKEGKSASSSALSWNNISNNGWGVQLTDKTSTDAVTSKLCTYVNNKPVISYSYMFYNSEATTIDLSNFDTSKVTNMSSMFLSSQAITIDLSSFDTSNVANMRGMFNGSQATTLDLSSFNTSNVKDMSYMFGVSKATTLDLSNFDTSKVYSMSHMFNGSKATTLDVSNFDTSKVTSMNSMFDSSKASSLDLSNFNTSKVTDMRSMFSSSQATTLDLSNFDTSKVTDMSWMFNGSKATSLDLSNFNTSKVTDMRSMFSSSQAITIDLSSFDTSNVANMRGMFNGSQATTLDLSNFDTSKVKYMGSMFESSKSTILDVSNFDTSNVIDMSRMFSNSQATALDLSSFNTNKVTDMYMMFYNSTIKTIYSSDKFNTNTVTSSTNMFSDCTSLIGGSGTKYNSSYTDKTYARIDGGTSNPGYFTDVSQKPSTFDTDDWATIVKSVKEGNTRKYKVGDTKEIDLGTTYGTHTLRIANTSTPSECSTSGFSQTACGFVLEFADIITTHNMNATNTNKNGWPSTSMRTFVNNDIYNVLPSDLKNGIIDTTVVSSHGNSESSNFTSTDKLYLLSPLEIYSDYAYPSNTSKESTRQLDYYNSLSVTTKSSSDAIKRNGTSATDWWLRSAYFQSNTFFFTINRNGGCDGNNSNGTYGVSPAFRIG